MVVCLFSYAIAESRAFGVCIVCDLACIVLLRILQWLRVDAVKSTAMAESGFG